MAKTYRISVQQNFIVKTTDIREVLLNYEFSDFSSCNSIVGETEYEDGSHTYTELSPCSCDQCECDNVDDYTEEGTNCEECYRDCVVTEG
jgi:hypothetical protein